jgi:hypothetical protein
MDELSPELVKVLSDEYRNSILGFNSDYSDILKEGFLMESSEEFNWLSENEKNMNEFA